MADNNQPLSIKDFSEFTDIKQSTLRYYDDIGLFSPMLRGDNGYRYYSPQQIITINFINVLSRLQVSTREMSTLIKQRTPETIMQLLFDKENALEADLRHIESTLDVVKTFRRLMFRGVNAVENVVYEDFLVDLPIVFGRKNDFSNSNSFYETFRKFCSDAGELRIDLCLPVGGYFPDMETFAKSPSQPLYFFSIDPKGNRTKSAGTYLVINVRGYYGETGEAVTLLQEYAEEHDLKFTGPVYNIYLLDEISVKDPDQYLLQVSVPVAQRAPATT